MYVSKLVLKTNKYEETDSIEIVYRLVDANDGNFLISPLTRHIDE